MNHRACISQRHTMSSSPERAMNRWFARLWSPSSRRQAPRPRRLPLYLEQLEDRVTPAILMVTTVADDLTPNDGSVSLREAMTAINAGNDLGDPNITAQSPGTFGTNDTINFNIPGTSPFQINVGGSASAPSIPLPNIVKPMQIDGTT